MKLSDTYKFFSILLAVAFIFVYAPQAKAEVVVEVIKDAVEDIAPIIEVVLMVAAVAVIGIAAGVIVGQAGLAAAPAIFTTFIGTAIITGTMVGAGLWAADCLFNGSDIDPDILCVGTSEEGAGTGPESGGQSTLEVDVRVDGSNGPITFRAPATFQIQWAIAGADPSTSCVATGDWSGNINNATGVTTLSDIVRGDYNYGIKCVKAGENEVLDSVAVKVKNLPICTFSSSPKTVVKPGKSVLSWQCQDADSCQIFNSVATTVNNAGGTLEVRPTEPTTYILTCSNIDGPINLTTEVDVLEPSIHEVPPGGE